MIRAKAVRVTGARRKAVQESKIPPPIVSSLAVELNCY